MVFKSKLLQRAAEITDPEEFVAQREFREELKKVLEVIGKRYGERLRTIMEMRYGLYDGDEWAPWAIAEAWGVSRKRVYQLLKRGHEVLLHHRRTLEPWLKYLS